MASTDALEPDNHPILEDEQEAVSFIEQFIKASDSLNVVKLLNQGCEDFMNLASLRHFENLARAKDFVAGLPKLEGRFDYAFALAGFIAPLRLAKKNVIKMFFKLRAHLVNPVNAWSILTALDRSIPQLSAKALILMGENTDYASFINANAEFQFSEASRRALLEVLNSPEYMNVGGILEHLKDYISGATYLSRQYSVDGAPRIYPHPYLTFCQRSGTGKTKLMLELGKKCFPSIYISLRGVTKSPDNIVSYLLNLGSGEAPEVRAAQLILSILDYVHLQKLQLSSSGIAGTELYQELLAPFMPGDPRAHQEWQSIIEFAKTIDVNDSVRFFKETEKCPVLISLDEASMLLDSSNESQPTPLKILIKVAFNLLGDFKGSKKRPFFLLLADTNAKVSNFAPSTENDPSLREAVFDGDLYPPVYEINTQDIFACDYLDAIDNHIERYRKGELCWWKFLEEREKDSSMAGFKYLGSPIWFQVLKADSIDDLCRFAEMKLLANKYPLTSIACRTSLLVNPSCSLASEMIASCMARLDLISEDRSMSYVSYPPDPSLASGGAKFAQLYGDKALLDLYNCLFSKNVLVGDIGELVAELLLLSATDGATSFTTFKAATLSDLFENLLSAEMFAKMKAALPEEYPVWDGRVFFNHFIRLNSPPTVDVLAYLFGRGAAALGFPNQAGVDIFIPICLPSGEMSFTCIQIKNVREFMDGTKAVDVFSKIKANEVPCMPEHDLGGIRMACLPSPKVGPHVLLNFCQGGSRTFDEIKFETKRVHVRLEGFSSKLYRMNWANPENCMEVLQKILEMSKGVEAIAKGKMNSKRYAFIKASKFWQTSCPEKYTESRAPSAGKRKAPRISDEPKDAKKPKE